RFCSAGARYRGQHGEGDFAPVTTGQTRQRELVYARFGVFRNRDGSRQVAFLISFYGGQCWVQGDINQFTGFETIGCDDDFTTGDDLSWFNRDGSNHFTAVICWNGGIVIGWIRRRSLGWIFRGRQGWFPGRNLSGRICRFIRGGFRRSL